MEHKFDAVIKLRDVGCTVELYAFMDFIDIVNLKCSCKSLYRLVLPSTLKLYVNANNMQRILKLLRVYGKYLRIVTMSTDASLLAHMIKIVKLCPNVREVNLSCVAIVDKCSKKDVRHFRGRLITKRVLSSNKFESVKRIKTSDSFVTTTYDNMQICNVDTESKCKNCSNVESNAYTSMFYYVRNGMCNACYKLSVQQQSRCCLEDLIRYGAQDLYIMN